VSDRQTDIQRRERERGQDRRRGEERRELEKDLEGDILMPFADLFATHPLVTNCCVTNCCVTLFVIIDSQKTPQNHGCP
jgi:hypothetical protein